MSTWRVRALVETQRGFRWPVKQCLGELVERCMGAFCAEQDFAFAFALGVLATSSSVATASLTTAVSKLFPVNDGEDLKARAR